MTLTAQTQMAGTVTRTLTPVPNPYNKPQAPPSSGQQFPRGERTNS